jgi:hypothetical protein
MSECLVHSAQKRRLSTNKGKKQVVGCERRISHMTAPPE